MGQYGDTMFAEILKEHRNRRDILDCDGDDDGVTAETRDLLDGDDDDRTTEILSFTEASNGHGMKEKLEDIKTPRG